MKARTGFVSNSSSASYTISVRNHDCEWMYETIGELLGFELEGPIYKLEGPIYKEAEQDIAWLKNQIVQHEKEVKEQSYKPDRLFIEDYPDRMKVLEDILEHRKAVLAGTPEDWKKHCAQIGKDTIIIRKLKVSQDYQGVNIEATTSMHNSFTDGMPAIMQELALALSFGELSEKYEFKIEKNG